MVEHAPSQPLPTRQGVTLDRSTLSNRVGRACWWLASLYGRVVDTVLASAKLSAASDGAARHSAMAMTLITTATLNGVEKMAYLTDMLECVVSGLTKSHQRHPLLPWILRPHAAQDARAMMQAMAA